MYYWLFCYYAEVSSTSPGTDHAHCWSRETLYHITGKVSSYRGCKIISFYTLSYVSQSLTWVFSKCFAERNHPFITTTLPLPDTITFEQTLSSWQHPPSFWTKSHPYIDTKCPSSQDSTRRRLRQTPESQLCHHFLTCDGTLLGVDHIRRCWACMI
jgi:hypothetical protein